MKEGRDRQKAISPMSDEAAAMPHIPRILQTETQDRPGDLRQECGHIQRAPLYPEGKHRHKGMAPFRNGQKRCESLYHK